MAEKQLAYSYDMKKITSLSPYVYTVPWTHPTQHPRPHLD